jgi:hypothetical protein
MTGKTMIPAQDVARYAILIALTIGFVLFMWLVALWFQ